MWMERMAMETNKLSFSEMRGGSLESRVISIDLGLDLTDVEPHKIVLVVSIKKISQTVDIRAELYR